MFVPMLLITISASAYAHWSTQLTCFTTLCGAKPDIEITNWIINSTNTQDANSNGKIFGDELTVTEIKDTCSRQITSLEIIADPIFPDWMLHLILQIHNRPSPYSLKVNVYFEIYYRNEITKPWVKITQGDLHKKFQIKYVDGFYLDANLTQPMPPNYIVKPGKYVYKSEYLKLDGDAPPTLEGRIIKFEVKISAKGACV